MTQDLSINRLRQWQRYPSYKPSGVEWLGDIPQHWEAKKIKRLSLVKRGASPRPIDEPIYFDDNGEYVWVRISDVTASNKYLLEDEQKLSEVGKSKSVPLESGELFLSICATVGKPIITKIKCCIHDGFVYFPELKENTEYLFYIFSGGELYKGLGKFGTQLNLNTDIIGDVKLPIPPLPEQEKIAQFLDTETAKLYNLINKKHYLIELLQEKRTALISHAVTKGINPDVPMKNSGVEWLGNIPQHWKVRKVKYLTEILRGKFTHRPRNDPKLYEGVYPFIQTGDIAAANKYITSYQQTLNELGFAVSKEFPEGTLVMSIAANIGDLAILSFKACFPDSIVGFVAKNNNNIHYLYYNFISLKSEMMGTATLNTQMNLNVERIGSLFSICPPLSEQEKIAQFLDQETAKIDNLTTKLRTSIDYLKEYRTALISAAVTGKIDVREEIKT